MRYLAHSAEPNVAQQFYGDHIDGVFTKASSNLASLQPYMQARNFLALRAIVLKAAIWHDLGKLCDHNQNVLYGVRKDKMVNHTDAGVALLLKSGRKDDRCAALLIRAHHRGFDLYPFDDDDFRDDGIVGDRCALIEPQYKDHTTRMYTDLWLPKMVARHNKEVSLAAPDHDLKEVAITSAFLRLALSCLVDGDHHDTAKNYKGFVIEETFPLRAKERLAKLDLEENRLQKEGGNNPRNQIKHEVYKACRNYSGCERMLYCASEVGTGKTFSVLAYGLHIADKFFHSGIIYVGPFTNIISQTVNAFRRAIVLPGEDPFLVIGEHHHQVDNDRESLTDPETILRIFGKGDDGSTWDHSTVAKAFAQTWTANIIATTAVQFLETLASCRVGKLRKYHQLAGRVIIIDESHACMPHELWAYVLLWLKFLTEELGCRVIFASGSVAKFWEMDRFSLLANFDIRIPSIIPPELAATTLAMEKKRVRILYNKKKWRIKQFCDAEILTRKGSIIIICNTINNAARVAKYLSRKKGRKNVEHLSTCLTPADREKILDRIEKRLKEKFN